MKITPHAPILAETPSMNLPLRFLSSLGLILLCWALDAELTRSQSVRGPELGFVFDRTIGALRPIRGIPGAATLGDPVELDVTVAEVWIAPDQEFALAAGSENGRLLLLDFRSNRVQSAGIGPDPIRPEFVAFSPSGRSAAMVDSDSREIRILVDLPNSPAFTTQYRLPVDHDRVDSIAVSDDGTAALIGTRGNVYVAHHGKIERLQELRSPSALSFFRNSHDALIADADDNLIFFVRDVMSNAAESVAIASQRTGIVRPIAVQPSSDGRRVFVINARSASISVINLETGHTSRFPCFSKPVGLYPLRDASVFRLNELAGTPLMLFDARSDSARIVFVPAPTR
jgi:DNA-binding beta-propeller fold protein YncE